MSSFIHHEPCPKCGSKDNLAYYDDGHKWCFGCGYYIPPEIKSLDRVATILSTKSQGNYFNLPIDFSKNIPKEPLKWLKDYGLSDSEIINNNIGWSDKEELLIFPFYGEDNVLLCWHGRYFPARIPKVFTRGYPDNHLLCYYSASTENKGRVVVVEDTISAIKVSRVVDSCVLLGANISMHKAVGLSRLFSHLTIWLDSDKLLSSNKFVEAYRSLFTKIDMVYTDLDPKMYSTEEIKEYLR